MEKGIGCKWNFRVMAGAPYFLLAREEVQRWEWLDILLSNPPPDGMVISQLRLGVFSQTSLLLPQALAPCIPSFSSRLFGAKDLRQEVNE